MQLHDIQVKKASSKKRIGRGGKRGTYSGKGMKGQKSRAGTSRQPAIRQWIKKYPKLRGYAFNAVSGARLVSINVSDLVRLPDDVTDVTPQALYQAGIITQVRGKLPKVKILSAGTVKRKLNVVGCMTSEAAAKKITKAGGTVETSPAPVAEEKPAKKPATKKK